MTKGQGKRTLADLLRDRIDGKYGTQRAFAEATGLPATYVNQILMGRVIVPGKEQRQVLAKELGIREVDMLVMGGEIPASDLRDSGTVLNGDEQELVDAFRRMTPELRVSFLTTFREFTRLTEADRG